MQRAAPAAPPGHVERRLAAPISRLLAGLACWAVAVAVAAQSAADYLRRPLHDRLVDLHVYVAAVTSFVHSSGLYAPHAARGNGFTYPPFAGLVLLPLAFVSEQVSRIAWTGLTMLAVAAFTLVVVRSLPRLPPRLRGVRSPGAPGSRSPGGCYPPEPPRRVGPTAVVWPLLIALLLASKPLQSNLRFGQVSIFLALAVLVDVVSLDGRPGQGILTGLCAAIKLTPLVFIPYLWLIGRRRAAAVGAGCFALATAAGAVVFPADSRAFWSDLVWHQGASLPLSENGNQSIHAVLLRAGVHGGLLTAAWAALCAAVTMLGMWRARRAWQAGQPLLGLAIVGCVGLLVSPISWTHHQIWILLAAAGLFSARPTVNLAVGAAFVLPMLFGLPGVHAASPVGSWLAANHRAVLALLIACAVPFVSVEPVTPGRALPGVACQVPAARRHGRLARSTQGAG